MTETPIYDVFISHAFEDKKEFTNELAMELTKAGLKVWYSGFELKLGDSIAGSVNKALIGAAFGIVVISPIYLKKQWAMNELNALFAQESGQKSILPILHNITVPEIKERFPILADRYTISSNEKMDLIIRKVLQAIAVVRKNPGKPFYNSKTNELPGNKNTTEKNMSSPANTNVNSSKNSNNVTVNTGNGKVVMLIILIVLALTLYFLYENSDLSMPGVDKEHISPSNAN